MPSQGPRNTVDGIVTIWEARHNNHKHTSSWVTRIGPVNNQGQVPGVLHLTDQRLAMGRFWRMGSYFPWLFTNWWSHQTPVNDSKLVMT